MRSERISGLDGPVEILRDGLGVPHCFAANEHDAFFAQGWAHACDRLFQMEYDRRRALGRWAEVVGERAVRSDLFHRRFDLASTARRDYAGLRAPTLAMLEAYAAGVSAAIESGTASSPTLAGAGVRPEPWEPWHSILVHRVRHLLMGSARSKLWRSLVAEALGPTAARAVAEAPLGGHLACVPPGAPCAEGAVTGAGTGDEGSNNWALAGSRTASGSPLLAGDPHRELEAPNAYVQGHVHCDRWDVLGIGIPGVPGFSHFGHNERVAWCITHAMVDDQDVYAFDHQPEVEVRVEEVTVRGSSPVAVEVARSSRGPLVAEDLAIAWTATAERSQGFDAIYAMLRATSVDELFESMKPWTDPANNLLAADAGGHIGYLMRGRVPRRKDMAAAWLPVDGDDPRFGWDGWVPFEELPRLVDPEEGFLFSANNPQLPSGPLPDPGSGQYFGLDVAAPWRASRLVAALSEMEGATVEDMAALHRDRVSLPGRWWARRLPEWAPLAGWDGEMEPGSTAAAAYAVFRRQLALVCLERSGLRARLEDDRNRLLPGILPESVMWRTVHDLALTGDTALLGGWSWEEAIAESMTRTEREWRGEPWGELHVAAPRHPLGDSRLDPPAVSYGGDGETVFASGVVVTEGLGTRSGSVARYAFDTADWDRSGWVIPLGASAEPTSPHFADQQSAWAEGRLLASPYSRRAVEAAAVERVELLPA